MSRRRNNRAMYITIMVKFIQDYHLKPSEILVFSLIYGFSQDGKSVFAGSLNYISDTLNLTSRQCWNILQTLMQKGLIGKREIDTKSGKMCDYFVTEKVLNDDLEVLTAPMKKFHDPMKKFHDPYEKISYHNTIDNTSIYNTMSSSAKKIENSEIKGTKIALEIKDFYNTQKAELNSNMRTCKVIRGDRLKNLNARIRENSIETVKEVITKAIQSDFLNGRCQKVFFADLEWILRPANFDKILNGKYDNIENYEHEKYDRRRGADVTEDADYDCKTF